MPCVTLKSSWLCLDSLFMGILSYLIEHIFLLKTSHFVSVDLVIMIHLEWASVAVCELPSHFSALQLSVTSTTIRIVWWAKLWLTLLVLCIITVTASFTVDCRRSCWVLLKNIVLVIQCYDSYAKMYHTKHSSVFLHHSKVMVRKERNFKIDYLI